MSGLTLKPAQLSRSSSSSASSLSSTFSDLDSSSTSKTNAFFASPFSTQPPSPTHSSPQQLETEAPSRSLTADFFATPVRLPSPPASTTTATVKRQQRTVHPSRIFPSRYTSTVERSPDFVSLDVQSLSPPSYERSPSSSPDSSFNSSFAETRLPTPPPPPFKIGPSSPPNLELSSSSEPTPRPPNLEPTLLHFERSLLLAAQQKQNQPQSEPEQQLLPDDDEDVEEDPHPGSIISLDTNHLPQFSLSPLALTFPAAAALIHPPQDDRGTPTPTNEPSSKPSKTTTFSPNTFSSALPTSSLTWDDSVSTPTLRLLRPLGHGAFSAVWLAEDLSPVPLTFVSKKSVRDLRRRVSDRDKERKREKEKGKGRATRDEEKVMQGDQVKLTNEPSSTRIIESSPRRPPKNLRDGLKSILSLSRLPKLGGYTDDFLSKSPFEMEPPSSTSLHHHQDADMDMDSSNLSRTSSNQSSSSSHSYSPLGTRISHHPTLSSAVIHRDSACLSRDSSLKKFRERVRGTRPAFRLGRAYLDERHGEMGWKEGIEMGGEEREDENHLGANLSRHSNLRSNTINGGTNGRLVAVKMTPRKVRGAKGRRERAEEERTRVGFVREVEVLKHISHPNITPLLAHLSTLTHHVLVLPYLSGGDLLGLVNNDIAWGKLGESVLRRIWCELCKAVGWMHGVGLVHRDIKLENILLTTSAFNSLIPSSPPPTLSSLPTPPAPFIKLTDFGLSRFVEIDVNGEAELLWTRCGSEAYAAPELVTGGSGDGSGRESRQGKGEGGQSGRRGVYDARKTDAWACGVVLYALVGRQLPFGEGVAAQPIGGGSRIGGERERGAAAERGSLAERRHWLMRIARGEYEWPGDQGEGVEENQLLPLQDELIGSGLVQSRGARRIVGRLLIRDPGKRARIGDLWDDSWMTLDVGGSESGGRDEGWWKEREKERDDSYSPSMEGSISETQDAVVGHENYSCGHEDEDGRDVQGRNVWMFDQAEVTGGDSYREEGENDGDGEDVEELLLEEEEDHEGEEEEEEGGCLFDHEGIDSITRQEVV